jgi:hypothetical protein
MSDNPHHLYTVFSITDDKKAVPVANYFYNTTGVATERGDIYMGMSLITLGSSATSTMHLNTGSVKDTYLIGYEIATSSPRVTEKMYESPTITTGTTEIDLINTNRQTGKTFTGNVYTDSVVTSTGTIIEEAEVYEAKKSLGGLSQADGIRILFEKSTDYILQITNGDNNSHPFFIKFYLYER